MKGSIDFNGMSTILELFHALKLVNQYTLYIYTYIFFILVVPGDFCTVIQYQVFPCNTNNYMVSSN